MREIINAIENDLGAGPKEIVFNSNFHRFPIKRTDKDGWYVAQTINKNSETHFMCAYGSWKDFEGTKKTWFSWEDDPLEPQKYAALNRQAKKLIKIAEDEKEKEQIEKAKKAENIFSKLETIGESPYLKKKGFSDLFGARLQKETLVVPIKNSINKITSLLFIKPDGTKRFLAGGKKQGGSFQIGPEIKEKSTVYICEGFATACSVYMATKEITIVAFDSNNLFNVAQLIRQKSPMIRIVICADNDGEKLINNKMKNPGIEAAEKAAKASNGVVVFPPDSPMDFNDMHMSLGLDSVREVILGAEIKKMPTIRPLGIRHNSDESTSFCFFTSNSNTIVNLKANEFTPSNLLLLNSDVNYWKTLYPNKSGSAVDAIQAASSLMSQCYEVSEFSRARVRKSGVWKDGTKIIVNTGNNLLIDKKPVDYADFKSSYIYCASNAKLPAPTKALEKEKVDDFFNLLSKLSWKEKNQGPIYLLGWLFIAPLSGTLRWRPHIWITGARGSGKSWIHSEVVSKILYYGEISEGTSTEASIRQNLNSASIPLIFDEADGDKTNSARRIDNIIEMLRSASSSVTPIKKGTPSGKVLEFLTRFSAALFSIKVGLEHSQDISRFTCLEMLAGNKEDFQICAPQIEEMLTSEFCDQFFYRSVFMIDNFKKNFAVFSKVLQTISTARFADQHGTLLAGYYTALNDDVVTTEMAEFICKNLVHIEDDLSSDTEKDEDDCASHLANSIIKDQHNQNYAVHELVRDVSSVASNPIKPNSYDFKVKTLGLSGISVSKCGQFVHVSKKNAAVRKLFNGTSWSNRRWEGSLLRIFGAKDTTSKIIGKVDRAIKLPINAII